MIRLSLWKAEIPGRRIEFRFDEEIASYIIIMAEGKLSVSRAVSKFQVDKLTHDPFVRVLDEMEAILKKGQNENH